jgi:uncharacterized protein (DUF433 family)
MSTIIVSDPEILGGKPIVKGTRIPVEFVFELLGLNYSVEYILDQFPSLTRDTLMQLIQIGQQAQKHLCQVDWHKILPQEPPTS